MARKRKRKKKNPATVVPYVLGTIALVGIGGIATVMGIRAIKRRRQRSLLLPPEPQRPADTDESWREQVNIENAMPTLADFPMGWKAGTSPGGTGDADYSFSYRVLELNAPTASGHQWVAVVSGANSIGEVTTGWSPTFTREEAFDEIAREEIVVSEA